MQTKTSENLSPNHGASSETTPRQDKLVKKSGKPLSQNIEKDLEIDYPVLTDAYGSADTVEDWDKSIGKPIA
ncbi:MAG: hypothetical protein PHG00_17605 [Methylococcales bacterium]|nr:hypothetical protein [Methylococcales bacterium]